MPELSEQWKDQVEIAGRLCEKKEKNNSKTNLTAVLSLTENIYNCLISTLYTSRVHQWTENQFMCLFEVFIIH